MPMLVGHRHFRRCRAIDDLHLACMGEPDAAAVFEVGQRAAHRLDGDGEVIDGVVRRHRQENGFRRAIRATTGHLDEERTDLLARRGATENAHPLLQARNSLEGDLTDQAGEFEIGVGEYFEAA